MSIIFLFSLAESDEVRLEPMNDNPEDRLLRPADVAVQLDVKRNTVWQYCRDGRLPHIRLSSRNFRIRQRDLDSFLDARCR